MKFIYKKDYFDLYKGNYNSISDVDFLKVISFFPEQTTKFQYILDMGSGSGAFSKPLAKYFPNAYIVGVDLCKPLLQKSSIPCCCGDVLKMPFKSDSFDCIVAAAAFHHFTNLTMVIKEVFRCLKKGGVFFAYEPNKFHPHRLIFMTNPLRHIFYKTGDHAISPYKFFNQLKNTGFSNIETNYFAILGNETSKAAKLNYNIIKKIDNPPFKKLLPFVSPWFIISGVK